MDKYSGQSGTFRVNSKNERELVKDSVTKPHEEGDAPRDADGKRLDRGADQQEQAKPQPALPEPPKTAPWATPTDETNTKAAGPRKGASSASE